MRTSPLFTPGEAEVDRLIADNPFAQFVSMGGDGRPVCTPLPLLLQRDADEAWLIGHFARANPHVELLRRQPRALAIFLGAHGYISPSWMKDRTQAPTWNYATAHIDVEVVFEGVESAAHSALESLVTHMERGRPNAWSALDMGDRYVRLASAVVAFRARILTTSAKFKLGQNEREDVFTDILAGLRTTGQDELAQAMEIYAPRSPDK